MPKPMMRDDEIELVTKLIADQTKHAKPVKCLEWGSGYSTAYWPGLFLQHVTWLAIEHNPDWYARVVKSLTPKLAKHVVVNLHTSAEDYIHADYLKPNTFDFILVDGQHRVECLKTASKLVKPTGVVVLHDSSREGYRPGYVHFDYVEELAPGAKPKDAWHQGLTLFKQAKSC